jgi:hypothetical protein
MYQGAGMYSVLKKGDLAGVEVDHLLDGCTLSEHWELIKRDHDQIVSSFMSAAVNSQRSRVG